jgi:glycosyltransferase involved in cell wall biosynthesis
MAARSDREPTAAPKRSPTITVVICAYSSAREAELLEAVASVERQTWAAHETVVVVDHNDELLGRLGGIVERATVLASSFPAGLSGARNAGVAAATGDVVAFLDDDATAHPDWLEQLAGHYRRAEVTGVGGFIAPAWIRPRPGWFPEEFNWVIGCSYRGLPSSAAPVRNLIGANMSFRREAIERVGGFASGIGRVGERPAGWGLLEAARHPKECEETELCLRLQAEDPDAVLLYEPAATVQHLVGPDRSTWAYFVRRCYAEGTSKALIARLAGPARGLSSERAYATRALPDGVGRAIGASLRERRVAPLGRAAAIATGFSAVAFGFALGLAVGKPAAGGRRSARV